MGFNETRFSSDPEIRALYSNIWALRMAAFQAAGVAVLHEQGGYEKIALGKQNHAPLRDVAWRFPDPSPGDLAEVQTVCSRCRSFLFLDRFPKWSMFGDGYICPMLTRCSNCKYDVRHTSFVPADTELPCITSRKFYNMCKEAGLS